MKTQISIPISTSLFLDLTEFLRNKRDSRDPVLAISDAIDYWMENASWKPELLNQRFGGGYQWKSVFLPDGTEMRMQYKGRYHYAEVQGDRLIYESQAMSPSGLANAITGSSRNAWRDLWIKRPSDEEWCLADTLRDENSSANET